MISETNALILALIGGVVPALFWLWFWIREDRLRPEPKMALLSAFTGGIVAVLLALFLELALYHVLVDARASVDTRSPAIFWVTLQNLIEKYQLVEWQTVFWGKIQDFFLNIDWSFLNNVDPRRLFLVAILAPIIEESLKFILTYNICLRRKVNDEPIDPAIYMLTAALGFAAVETALFLTEPLSHGKILDSLIAGNFRSIGPMLIHLISSAMLGIMIGLAFYKSRLVKALYSGIGLLLAIGLHMIFNLLIYLNDSSQHILFFWLACFGTWILVVVLLMFFERVKMVARKV
jgi:RsiW-degrading membrane proteinase PrsW (M82 family)